MANFVFWSDLHIEHRAFDLPPLAQFADQPDAVLLAGDTDKHPKHFDFAKRVCDTYDCPVVMINGNHEYYDNNIDDVPAQEAAALADLHAQGYPIHMLRGQPVVIAGARIIGATLWTDYNLGSPMEFAARQAGLHNISDFSRIKKGKFPHTKHIEPLDTVVMHVDEKENILRFLDEKFDGPTVVMSHHMPALELISARYNEPLMNPAFASDMLKTLVWKNFDAWIYGHTHHGEEISFAVDNEPNTPARRFLTNPRGYPHEITRFDPLRMLHL